MQSPSNPDPKGPGSSAGSSPNENGEGGMIIMHGSRRGRATRKGVDDYVRDHRLEFQSRLILMNGQLIQRLVCRFCDQTIGARSDRIKEHLSSKRHMKNMAEGPPAPLLTSPTFGDQANPTNSVLQAKTLPSSRERICVRWGNHSENTSSMFSQFQAEGSFTDVTLCCGGEQIHCHKVVLAAASPYFERSISSSPNKYPVFFLSKLNLRELRALVDFIYSGEMNIERDQLIPLIRAAEELEILGLTASSVPHKYADGQGRSMDSSSSSVSGSESSPEAKTSNIGIKIKQAVPAKSGTFVMPQQPRKAESEANSASAPPNKKRKAVPATSTNPRSSVIVQPQSSLPKSQQATQGIQSLWNSSATTVSDAFPPLLQHQNLFPLDNRCRNALQLNHSTPVPAGIKSMPMKRTFGWDSVPTTTTTTTAAGPSPKDDPWKLQFYKWDGISAPAAPAGAIPKVDEPWKRKFDSKAEEKSLQRNFGWGGVPAATAAGPSPKEDEPWKPKLKAKAEAALDEKKSNLMEPTLQDLLRKQETGAPSISYKDLIHGGERLMNCYFMLSTGGCVLSPGRGSKESDKFGSGPDMEEPRKNTEN